MVTDYARHFGVTWKAASRSLRIESPAAICFEIEDKKPSIVQPKGHGVAVIRRNANDVEIIDLEAFTKQIHGEDNTPSCCDFAISPRMGCDFLLLNELTKTSSDYIYPFKQPKTGVEQDGKLETAKRQLTVTIERLYSISDFCDQYREKTALFSCRLSDKRGNGMMAKSARAFNKTIYSLQRLRFHESLPHGFVFKMRVYDAEYRI
ncbi:MAG: hypothetical protein IJT30_01960 [Muribaculaceae bacterium]|nr:hypothetical protein [Muribaculaceae bacterium]